MFQTLKYVATRNPFVFLKVLKNVNNALKQPHMAYNGINAFYTTKALEMRSEKDKLILEYYLNKQDNAGKKVTVILQELLQIRPKEAIDIVSKYKKFIYTSWTLLEQNYKLCVEHGIQRKYLLSFPEILAEQQLYDKIRVIKEFPNYDVNDLLPLVRLPLKTIEQISIKPKRLQRIEDISKIFEVTIHRSCEMLANKPFLFQLKLDTINSNLRLLQEKGISKEEVQNDLWVLKYSTSLIQTRLNQANEVDCIPRTWMVRCKHGVLENHIKRTSEKKDILGDSSVAKYLSERLSCSEEMAKYIFYKLPALESKSLTKINRMIDFLIEKGFTTEQISRMPKILLHSVETTKTRLQEIEAISTKKEYLYILTKSQKQYQQHLETLAKVHGKKLT